MDPRPDSGVQQRGAELFLFPFRSLNNILFHFKLLYKNEKSNCIACKPGKRKPYIVMAEPWKLHLFRSYGRESIKPSGCACFSGTCFLQHSQLFLLYSLACCRCLPVLVYLFRSALQERRFAMTDYTPQPATFRVDKYQAYEDGKVLFEQYTIFMYIFRSIPVHFPAAY